MTHIGTFPFGQPIRTVRQLKRGSKRIFVLGVYASAVHAKWIGADRKTRVKALGVASEPEIFWNGDGAADLIKQVKIPEEAGCLVPTDLDLNGPSGRALDERYLKPLGVTRADVWLCDLVPHSCMNAGQSNAIEREYCPLMGKLDLPAVKWPTLPKKLTGQQRIDEIAEEVSEASPEILVTLGDDPLCWFTKHFGTESGLASYGESSDAYGHLHEATIAGCQLHLLPLVHPRQAAKLGKYSPKWFKLHEDWIMGSASDLI